MKKFRFKFESVERVRKTRENELLTALARAQQILAEGRRYKAEQEKKLADALLRREKLGQEPMSTVAWQTETDFITGTKQRILMAENGIKRAQRGVEKALKSYLIAKRETRAIELLREKAFDEFRREKAKKEQKELDDLYLMRARMSEGELER